MRDWRASAAQVVVLTLKPLILLIGRVKRNFLAMIFHAWIFRWMVNDCALHFISRRLSVTISQVTFAIRFGRESVIAESAFIGSITVMRSHMTNESLLVVDGMRAHVATVWSRAGCTQVNAIVALQSSEVGENHRAQATGEFTAQLHLSEFMRECVLVFFFFSVQQVLFLRHWLIETAWRSRFDHGLDVGEVVTFTEILIKRRRRAELLLDHHHRSCGERLVSIGWWSWSGWRWNRAVVKCQVGEKVFALLVFDWRLAVGTRTLHGEVVSGRILASAILQMDLNRAGAWKSSIAHRTFVLLARNWRSDALLAQTFGNYWKLIAGEIDECQIFEALLNVQGFVVATAMSVESLVTLENHFAVSALCRNRRMFFIHVILQVYHAVKVVANANGAAELLKAVRRHDGVVVVIHSSYFVSVRKIVVGAFSLVWEIRIGLDKVSDTAAMAATAGVRGSIAFVAFPLILLWLLVCPHVSMHVSIRCER